MTSSFFLDKEKLIWIIEEPYLKTSRISPNFILSDMNWYFKYDFVKAPFHHWAVYMLKESKEICRKPFEITVYFETVTGTNSLGPAMFPRSSEVSGFDQSTEVWSMGENYGYSDFYGYVDRPNTVMKLSFAFDGCIYPKLQVTQGDLQKLSDSCADSLSEDLKVLLTDSVFSDVELKCKDESVKAHRIILSARSKVFSAMLHNDMKERRSGVVKIEDFDADVLKKFLHYIYTGTLPDLTMDVAYKLYDAGEKYAVFGLKGKCAVYLAENLSEDNACDLLVTADLHSDEMFKEKAIAFILEKKIPSKKDIWTTFRKSHPDLASEVLTIAYERQNK